MIKAVLFDLDGVLVNMPDGHYEALNKTLRLFGAKIEQEEHQKYFNGLPTRKKIEELERQGRLPNGLKEFINELKQKYTKDIIPNYCIPDYSKIILLKQLQAKKIKLACCSNSIRETVDLMLQSAQIHHYFDLILGNDEVENPKPDPEIYHKAFEKLRVTAEECIIVEDSIPGIEAARRSGAKVCEVRGCDDVNITLFKDLLFSPEKIPAIERSRFSIDEFTKGWIVGDFEPSLLKTKEFEVAVKYYQKGDQEARHVHRVAREITIIVTGKFLMNNHVLVAGDIMSLQPGESADFYCIENGATTVIKTPSVQGDKYLVT